MQHFFEQTGLLVFGTRLRRLSELFLAEVNAIYKERGIDFDATWFPVFYLLSKQSAVSIKDLADQLNVSHSAVSQLISILQYKKLVTVDVSSEDARKKELHLSAQGKKMLAKIEPIWTDLQEAMQKLVEEGESSRLVLQAIREIESGMEKHPLRERVNKLK